MTRGNNKQNSKHGRAREPLEEKFDNRNARIFGHYHHMDKHIGHVGSSCKAWTDLTSSRTAPDPCMRAMASTGETSVGGLVEATTAVNEGACPRERSRISAVSFVDKGSLSRLLVGAGADAAEAGSENGVSLIARSNRPFDECSESRPSLRMSMVFVAIVLHC